MPPDLTRSRLQRFLDTPFAETELALLFTAACFALLSGLTPLVGKVSAIG